MPEADLQLALSSPRSVGIATYPPGATFGPRPLRDYEFVWIMQGDAEYRRGNVQYSAPQNSIVLCRPGATDFFRWDQTRRTRHAFFHFAIRKLPPGWPPAAQWPVVRPLAEADIIPALFHYLLTWLPVGDSPACSLTMELLLTTFVHQQSHTSNVPPEMYPEAVERALQWMHSELERDAAAPIALPDLARAACVTPEHLCRLYKESTGLSPLETVRLARLDRAATLLARSNYSIQEIATLCGFASPFHFSRKFKETFGSAPRNLRQEMRNGRTPPLPKLTRFGTFE